MRLAAAFALVLLSLSCKEAPPPPPPAPPAAPAPAAVPAEPPVAPPVVEAPPPPPPPDTPEARAARIATYPAIGPNELEVAVAAGPGKDLGDAGTAFPTMLIFQKATLAKAKGPVFLHLDGVAAGAESEAEIYLASNGPAGYVVEDYIGSIATVAGPVSIPDHQLEVNDFEVEGHKYHARTSLKTNPHFGVVMVVQQGWVRVDRFVLSTRDVAERTKAKAAPSKSPASKKETP